MAHRDLVQLFRTSVSKHGETPAMRYKRGGTWQTVTYAGLGRFAEDLAGGLLSLGVRPGEKVAVWSGNSPEWVVTDFAVLSTAAVTVPVYETLTPEQAAYILNDSEARIVFVQDEKKLEAVLSQSKKAGRIEHFVVMGPVPAGYVGKPNIWGMDQLYAQGRSYLAREPRALDERARQIDPDQLASLVYTSGTTGNPKGVMLTHRNLASNVAAVNEVLPISKLVFLGFLPLCHSFARIGDQYFAYSTGSTVVFAEGIEQLTANMKEVRPHIMNSVPRLYEKMYAKILDGVNKKPPKKQKIFHWAVGVGGQVAALQVAQKPVPLGLKLKHKVAHALVFKKLHEATGGRLKVFVSGGAALSKEIQEFFAAAGLWILQGYGLTETSPVISLNTADAKLETPKDYRFGSTGKPLPGVTVKIADDGEILAKGSNVCKGYYKLEKETRELIDADGWLHTGDIGKLDEDGFLYITDRKKELFKTSYGKYIAPQVLEGKLKNQPHVAMAVILGENKQYVGALITPNFERVEPWAKAQGIAFVDRSELVRDPKVVGLIQADVDKVNAELARYEQIKRFELLDRELTQDAGELTPTLKFKRRVINEKYREKIASLFVAST